MKHLSISNWLTQLGLTEYCTLFDEQYDGVEDLLHLTEVDLRKMGIENQIHRTHIISNILLLQEAERKRALSSSKCSEWRDKARYHLTMTKSPGAGRCLPDLTPRLSNIPGDIKLSRAELAVGGNQPSNE
ncbi:hypothetical protein Y1Q_0007515 [Alligator mississippiensis]|uniref:SAM domain-containing protein n=1 Tax=Alligator mississippiensis TaxID=8496 RepID=A0A151M4Z3_ALLMI|nr:hypothetical protein Y1Q_0007515 [Alligator mississippiensis]